MGYMLLSNILFTVSIILFLYNLAIFDGAS